MPDKFRNSYIIEFHKIGNSVKVSAIDPKTLTEVSTIGSSKMTKDQLTNLAVRKLEYVLNKKS